VTIAFVLLPALLYAVILGLHLALPARKVTGYVSDAAGQKLTYRLNGLPVFFSSIALWALACWQGVLPWDAFYLHRWEMLAGACVLGLAFTLAVVVSAPRLQNWSFAKEFYLGRAANPQWLHGRVDAKMFLYLIGAVMLELNLLSFAAHHVQQFPVDPSPGVLLYLGLFSFFLVEYLFFEEVHLYTYDFVAENVGFKLGWGCFVFYPFFYGVGLWMRAEAPNPHTPWYLLAGAALLFFAGWMLSRGANLQKYWFKKDPTHKAFGLLAPEALTGPNGHKVLVSGFWGVSRHVNYLGEILMATGLTLSLGAPLALGPWLYPLYYVVLLLPRQLDDDKRCASKYGPMWLQYQQRVPWRIVPFVY
jgi:protein-S-isoprenylcysteine O-methyltransferase Ste14